MGQPRRAATSPELVADESDGRLSPVSPNLVPRCQPPRGLSGFSRQSTGCGSASGDEKEKKKKKTLLKVFGKNRSAIHPSKLTAYYAVATHACTFNCFHIAFMFVCCYHLWCLLILLTYFLCVVLHIFPILLNKQNFQLYFPHMRTIILFLLLWPALLLLGVQLNADLCLMMPQREHTLCRKRLFSRVKREKQKVRQRGA